MIGYDSGKVSRNVTTPTRRHTIKQVYRREFSSALQSLRNVLPPEQMGIAHAKVLIKEIENLSSKDSSNCFHSTEDSLRTFKWDMVWNELESNAPVLLHFFQLLFRGAPKALICFAISMVIKWRAPKLGLVQRVVSVLLYGNGASKQVSLLNFNKSNVEHILIGL